MRFNQPLLLALAAICGVCFIPQSSYSQSSPAAQGPFLLTADTPASVQGSSPRSDFASPARLANNQALEDESLDRPLFACACGCGVFEVGTASMLPQGQGGMLYLEYDYQDQNINWSGVKPAPASQNDDVNIRTNFITLGLEYFFDRTWGVQVELPYANRHWETADDSGGLATLQWGSLGDVRLQGIYTGFSEDQSIGVSFGVKLPTGNYTHPGADRDTQIGTGCVDLLLGGFFRHEMASNVTGFAQFSIDAPIDECQGYRPGLEADGALGAYYTGLAIGGVKITPIAQLLISERGHDTGPNAASPLASGYQRLLLSPGLEFDFHPFSIYADIEVPFYQHVSGDQLTAPFLMKVILTYHF